MKKKQPNPESCVLRRLPPAGKPAHDLG